MASSRRKAPTTSCWRRTASMRSCTACSTTPPRPRLPPQPESIPMSRSLIVLPDDTSQPFLAAIAAAKKSLRIKMCVFEDPGVLAAVLDARKRGIDVRVMLNPARRSGEEENVAARKALTAGGVFVQDSNPAFDLTHEK